VNLVLALDAAWGGTGWCLASNHAPIRTGHVALGARAWRWPALIAFLESTILDEVADAQLLQAPGDLPLRLVIEMPPAAYSGTERWAKPGAVKKPAGNQALTGYGLGTLSGALQLWWCMQPGLGYPWLVQPMVWRRWMGVGGTGRSARKAAAIESCQFRGWGRFLEGHRNNAKDGGAMGDVAESMLLAVGAARNILDAPVGPAPKRPATKTTRIPR